LDRAYLRFEPEAFRLPFDNFGGLTNIAISAGRFDNPFWSPTDLVWHVDLGFDGVALQTKHKLDPTFTAFGSAGAFPIFNTSMNFATTEPVKFQSEDRYLFGAQIGLNWQALPTLGLTFGAGIFDFNNVQGRLSSPCLIPPATACDTDHLRPSFAQRGNS